MKGKILLVVGLGIGYVLGARAGRQRYEQIRAAAEKLWNDPRVQRQVNQAEDFVKDKAPEVVEFIADGAKKVVAHVSSSKKAAEAARAPRATPDRPAPKRPAPKRPASK